MTEPTRTVDLYNSGIFLEIDGIQVSKIDLPSGYVPYHFMPLIDKHAIVSGDKLQNGMIVLVESRFRENPDRIQAGSQPSAYDRRKVQETARWALVTDFNLSGQIISFTGIYADGTMAERGYNQSIKWTLLKEFTFAGVQDPNACEFCNEVHDQEEPARTVADDPKEQPAYDLMDSAANLVGILLYPEAKTRADRITSVKKALLDFDSSDFMDGFFEGLFEQFGGSDLTKDDFAKQPGTSIVDDVDQSTFESEEDRIEAEEAAAAERQRILDDEALAALREKLTGIPRSSR